MSRYGKDWSAARKVGWGDDHRLIEKECRCGCGEMFTPQNIKQRYKDPTHAAQGRHSLEPRACANPACPRDEPFRPRYQGQTYCSNACRERNEVRVCARPGCGESFVVKPHDQRKYHNEECRRLARMTNAVPGEWFNGKPRLFYSAKSRNATITYIRCWWPDHPNASSHGWVPEHVVVICRKLGVDRVPEGYEVDHWPDRDGRNNSPDNLTMHPKKAHAALTASRVAGRAALVDQMAERIAELEAQLTAQEEQL